MFGRFRICQSPPAAAPSFLLLDANRRGASHRFGAFSLFCVFVPAKEPGPGPCVVYFGLFCWLLALHCFFFFAGRFGAELLFEPLPFGCCVALRCAEAIKADSFLDPIAIVFFFLFDFVSPYPLAASLSFFCGRGAIGRHLWLRRHHCCAYHTDSVGSLRGEGASLELSDIWLRTVDAILEGRREKVHGSLETPETEAKSHDCDKPARDRHATMI